MKLVKTTFEQIDGLVKISKAAFDNDVTIGATNAGGPPQYDDAQWHIQMMKEGHLFTAVVDDKIVGGAVLFVNGAKELYVGRIFISPDCHRKGYGIELMKCIENQFSYCTAVFLDTPLWNVRTNAFYCKLGYTEVKRDDEFVFYKKNL